MMNRPPPTLNKWVFVLADLLMLAAFAWTLKQVLPVQSSFGMVVVLGIIAGWMWGAWLCVKPWLEEFKAQNQHLENETLTNAVEKIQKLEEVAARIQAATGSWQSAQDSATRVAAAAREIEEKIRGNMKEFIEFNERINSEEKKHMGLEIEKLRRMEGEWLQVSARMLDHTFLLNQAAERSGQANLINQLGNFQNALRDTARRMGLVPFVPAVGEAFDPRAHQTETPETPVAEGSIITEILATGFNFQGQLLRRALVRVGSVEAPKVSEEQPVEESVAPEPAVEAPVETPVAEPEIVEPAASEAPPAENNLADTQEPEAEPAPRRRARKPDPQASLPF